MLRSLSTWLASGTVLLSVVTLAGCGGNSATTLTAATSSAPPAIATTAAVTSTVTSARSTTASSNASASTVTVFAAASLTDAFSEIGKNYIAAHPGTKFAFNFGGSPTLRTQLDQGARADVFASADIANMTGAEQDGTIASKPALFAQNKLEIIVPKANPGHIQTPADLAKPGIKLVLAAANVPVGNYARQVLQNLAKDPAYGEGFDTKALANVVSNEANVKDVVAKVQLAEADAGIVYVTDPTITVRPQVAEIAIPDASNVIAQYPIAVVKNAPNATGGQAFIDYVLSSDGQAVMQKYGFAAPPVALAQPQRALAALTMP